MRLRPFAQTLTGVALLALPGLPAAAATPSQPAVQDVGADVAGLAIVPDEELQRNRGGFAWKGVEIGLGAELRTYLNGELVLQTNVSWTAAGATTNQIVSGALTKADAAQLQAGILSTGGISFHVGDQSVFLANGGDTAIYQRTDGSIQNILVNRASNISARQEVDAALDLHNFGQFQKQLGQSRVADMVGDAIGQATVGALGN